MHGFNCCKWTHYTSGWTELGRAPRRVTDWPTDSAVVEFWWEAICESVIDCRNRAQRQSRAPTRVSRQSTNPAYVPFACVQRLTVRQRGGHARSTPQQHRWRLPPWITRPSPDFSDRDDRLSVSRLTRVNWAISSNVKATLCDRRTAYYRHTSLNTPTTSQTSQQQNDPHFCNCSTYRVLYFLLLYGNHCTRWHNQFA